MKRLETQLLARARSGDRDAILDAARRYLSGAGGFPHHIPTGLRYLDAPCLRGDVESAIVTAQELELQELVSLGQLQALRVAADAGDAIALLKLGAWCIARESTMDRGVATLRRAATVGRWSQVLEAIACLSSTSGRCRAAALECLNGVGWLDAQAVSAMACRDALAVGELTAVWCCLDTNLALTTTVTEAIAEVVVSAIQLAEAAQTTTIGLPASVVERCLDLRAGRNDARASLILGRALCGIEDSGLPAESIAVGTNMRKGAALLLRAADAGINIAWSYLHRVHSDHHASVANAQMARFFLEKAALSGEATAQRRLGTLILKSATTIEDSEQGMHWLSLAATAGDTDARVLLDSFVLAVPGDPDHVAAVIAQLHRGDPWVAWRLQMASDFGLTRLEALCVDPVAGERPWGLVVGPNAFIKQAKMASPRAIPATSNDALRRLRLAVVYFAHFCNESGRFEGNLRTRSVRLRRLLSRHRLAEEEFFAQANTSALDQLRHGAKWAFRHRDSLRSALAA